MSKIIQPISDPDKLRAAMQETSAKLLNTPLASQPATPQPTVATPAPTTPQPSSPTPAPAVPVEHMESTRKVVQPISSPEEIRAESEESVKEKFTDYYVTEAAPDPLNFHPKERVVEQPENPSEVVAEEAAANDPLNFNPHPLAQPSVEAADNERAQAEADNATANDPLKDV